MLSVAVMIPTYFRRDKLGRLLDQLARESGDVALTVFVQADGYGAYEDLFHLGDPLPLGCIGAQTLMLHVNWHERHHGKEEYWKTINNLWLHARQNHVMNGTAGAFDRFVQLADDFEICKSFFPLCEDLYQRARVEKTIGVSLHRCQRRELWDLPAGQWQDGYRHMGYCDGAWYSEARLFNALNWEVLPISKDRWARKPRLGSGVWSQTSKRLYRSHKYTFVQPQESFVLHSDEGTSKLNSGHPRQGKLVSAVSTVAWIDDPKVDV